MNTIPVIAMRNRFLPLFLLILTPLLPAQTVREHWRQIIGSAYVDNASYDMLRRICDEAGGRLSGSAENERALGILTEELSKLGISSKLERYTFPGFVRGEDVVRVAHPFKGALRAVALGYTNAVPPFEADLAAMPVGDEKDFKALDVRNMVVLHTGESLPGRTQPLRSRIIESAASHGARSVLFIDARGGGMTLVGTANFQGNPSPVPAFSITLEEGRRLQRLLEHGSRVTVSIKTLSRCAPLQSANLVVSFPGRSERKIVVGAHFDSWDVSQGAVDNGIGSAILFDVARLLHRFTRDRQCAIECVWFNGEELGLWGAKKYLETHAGDDIAAMINMDMTGSPTGFNAMGSDSLLPFLGELAASLNGFGLRTDPANRPWTNSDHQPFMTAGIPTLTLQARLDEPMSEHYHDFGDTFDKVSKRYLSDAAAIVSILVSELSDQTRIQLRKRSREENIEFLRAHKLEETLRNQGEWTLD